MTGIPETEHENGIQKELAKRSKRVLEVIVGR